VLAAYTFVLGVSQMLWLNFAPLIGLVKARYGVSEELASALIFVFPLLFVVLSVPAGALIDRRGYRFAVGAGAVLMAASSLVRIADTSFWCLLAGQIGVAIAQPFVSNGISKIVADWFSEEHGAVATGLGTMGMFIGMALGHRSTNTASETAVPAPNITPASATKQKFVLLLHGPARARPLTQRTSADSASERAIVAEYSAWARGLAAAGSLVMAEKLADDPPTMLAASGATEAIRGTADELGGFFVIQAADSAEAFRIARDCPHLRHGGTVQVRRIEPT